MKMEINVTIRESSVSTGGSRREFDFYYREIYDEFGDIIAREIDHGAGLNDGIVLTSSTALIEIIKSMKKHENNH